MSQPMPPRSQGGFAIVYLIDLWLSRHKQYPRAPAYKRLYAAAVMLLVFYAISIWTALPAKDASGAVLVVRPTTAHRASRSKCRIPKLPLVLSSDAEPANRRSIQWLAWKVEWRLSDALTAGPDPTLLAGVFVLGVADVEVLQNAKAALSSARLVSGRVVACVCVVLAYRLDAAMCHCPAMDDMAATDIAIPKAATLRAIACTNAPAHCGGTDQLGRIRLCVRSCT